MSIILNVFAARNLQVTFIKKTHMKCPFFNEKPWISIKSQEKELLKGLSNTPGMGAQSFLSGGAGVVTCKNIC